MPGESAGQAARRVVTELERSYLAIQGPPGSGKTWIGGRMILDLVAQGKTVGVTAGSHKVIGNLLDNVWAAQGDHPAFAERQVILRQKPATDSEPTCAYAEPIGSAEHVADVFAEGSVDVVGGTAWLWASGMLPAESVDVLFIDEAGQFSLANAIAVSAVAKSIVMLGDPQQLDQPLKGSHPGGAEQSALAHLLGKDNVVMPPELGLFMDKTWRLHPDICAYTSEVFYRGELMPEAGNELQALAGAGLADGDGIRFVAVDHQDARNDNRSVEEARVIADIVCDLLADRPRGWTGTSTRPRSGRATSSSSRPTTRSERSSAPSSADAVEPARGSRWARWTSSRASRRRCRSTRWPPHDRRMRRAAWSSCTRSTGSTWPPRVRAA